MAGTIDDIVALAKQHPKGVRLTNSGGSTNRMTVSEIDGKKLTDFSGGIALWTTLLAAAGMTGSTSDPSEGTIIRGDGTKLTLTINPPAGRLKKPSLVVKVYS